MEALSCLLKRARKGGYLMSQGEGEKVLLMWFEALSRPKINLDKSEPTPIVRVENIDELVSKQGCKQGKLSSTYLGLPLGAPFDQ
ncbi:hypothetical protein CK203_042057 [Vitis vinifera]|uniref:Uncharacterized protein n=1 Tax=Vitis vinifera TaxID=29760 RepID=A0A438HH96_VITVI|nr:hypothetical protein CK203_042057 [Vitis vinifera]